MKIKIIRATFIKGTPVKPGVLETDEATARILKACGHAEDVKEATELKKG